MVRGKRAGLVLPALAAALERMAGKLAAATGMGRVRVFVRRCKS